MTHKLDIRVFYEDTDMAGIVYYANYLRFIERGRSSMLRDAGYSQNALRGDMGIVFAVTEVNAKYRQPAKLDDLLVVETDITLIKKARVVFRQCVKRGEMTLFEADVTVACMTLDGRPRAIPSEAHHIFAKHQA